MKKLALFLGGVILSMSCSRDKIDFDLADDLRFGPEMEVPLVNARLSLGDLVIKDTNLQVGSDNRITVDYLNDSIFAFNAFDFVTIPNQDPFVFPISPLLNPFDLEMSLGTLGGVELAETFFDGGFIQFDIMTANPFTTDVDVEVTIKNGELGGQDMSKIVTLTAGSLTVSDSLDITSGKIDFSNGGTNFIGLKAEILNALSVVPQTGLLELSVQMQALELRSASGDFGQRYLNIPNGTFDFDVSGFSEFLDGLYLTNPEIRLISTSNIGADLSVEADFDGVSESGSLTALGAQPQLINSPVAVTNPKVDTLTFNRTNSNIVDFVAAVPTSILYAGRVELNPAGGASSNFIDKDSKIIMGVQIKLPLEIQADNLILEQELEGLDFLQENPEEIESLNLIFNTRNAFPFDVDLSLAFLDSLNNDSIDGINLNLLVAPPVDGQGRVMGSADNKEVVNLSATALENLKKAKKLRLRARLSTPLNGQQVVTFYTDYNLQIRLATQVKLNVKTE